MIVTRLHIKDGKVINISVGDTDKPWKPPEGIEVVEIDEGKNIDDHCIGATYENGVFVKPPQPESKPAAPTMQEQIDALKAEVEKLKEALESK